ncbi:ATP-binding protein [Frigoribacterium sp. VKM Ac-2836]|uniref:ATP-binding protein n=1 Tax=Frigoribacterium sp. VKM Ac-2836 TaxID=2739014 RepID=UPI001566BE46|nr:ATP-binding protein [Frigoribacterium sp. VKM Ac-2836]NRD26574.1 putative DNA binding domain-containing protein [Frigoribacterium sp. VKM Ac-2836]
MEIAIQALDKVAAGAVANSVENQHVDFKVQGRSLSDTLDNLAEAAACFANAEGGYVLVGVRDDGAGPEAFVGHDLDPVKTRSRIYEITTPALMVDVFELQHAAGSVLVIRVPQGVAVHSVKSKLPTERVGESCWPMDTRRIAAIVDERSGVDWSAVGTSVAPSAADPQAIAVARRMASRAVDPSKRRLADLDELALLRRLGVVDSKGYLTNAGVLLFVGPPGGAALMSYSFRRTPAGRLSANEQLDGPLVVAVERVFDLISARLETTPVSVGKGQQLHLADLPEAAVREAIVNAAMHRDYRVQDRVTIEHAQTQLSVTSPGALVSGVTPTNILTTSSRSRNPQLAQALRMLDLAETAGSGVDRMYAEMTRLGHQPPVFLATTHSVQVSLVGGAPNTNMASFVATLPSHEADDADTMLVLLHLLTKRTLSASEMQPIMQKASSAEAQSVLARLARDDVGILEPTRETASNREPNYRLRERPLVLLGPAVVYKRRTLEQTDRKVIDLVRETSTINARMLKIMFDLDNRQVSRVLADLIARGVLIKTSSASRGPGVTYGAGPAFPRRRGATT